MTPRYFNLKESALYDKTSFCWGDSVAKLPWENCMKWLYDVDQRASIGGYLWDHQREYCQNCFQWLQPQQRNEQLNKRPTSSYIWLHKYSSYIVLNCTSTLSLLLGQKQGLNLQDCPPIQFSLERVSCILAYLKGPASCCKLRTMY